MNASAMPPCSWPKMLESASLQIDLWSTGYRGGIVHLPLTRALMGRGLNLRTILSERSDALTSFESLEMPLLLTAGDASPFNILSNLLRVSSVRRHLREFYSERRPIVHVTMASPWDQFYLDVPKRMGATILLTVHDARQHIGEENPFLMALENRLIRIADHIAVLSSYAADTIAPRVGPNRPVHVVSPGLVMNASPPEPPKKWPDRGPVRFLFFGRIRDYKGLDLVLEAWKMLKNGDSRATQLIIAGSGDLAKYTAALRGLPDVEVINGWISDEQMLRLFNQSHVNLIPYLEGSASATSLAGMWAGMPSIATPIGAFAEQLRHGRDSLVMRDISAMSLLDAMRELLASPELYDKLAQGAHHQAHELSAPVVASNWIGLYEQIWNQRRP